MLRDKGMPSEKVKEDLSFVVFLNKYLCSKRSVPAFCWKTMKFFGEMFQVSHCEDNIHLYEM